MTPPALGLPSYNCPHCRAFAQQHWSDLFRRGHQLSSDRLFGDQVDYQDSLDKLSSWEKGNLELYQAPATSTCIRDMKLSICSACNRAAVWFYGRMIFPVDTDAPSPSVDMPSECMRDYEEASLVLPISPRAAAALLRLSLEKLCAHLLKKPGGNINSMIGDFVKLGVPPQITNAMDVLRVVGNEAVHPGTMDAVDDQGTAMSLFGLINLIVDVMITQPKHVAMLYETLPAEKRAAIEGRNEKLLSAPLGAK